MSGGINDDLVIQTNYEHKPAVYAAPCGLAKAPHDQQQTEGSDACMECGFELRAHRVANPQTIREWQKESYANAANHGFHSRSPADREPVFLINLIRELTEAWEEVRKPDYDPVRIYYHKDEQGIDKPEGFPIELADAAIRLFDTAEAYGIDLQRAIVIKHEYNKQRPFRHGGKRA